MTNQDPFEIIRKANAEAVEAEANAKRKARLGCINWLAIVTIILCLLWLFGR